VDARDLGDPDPGQERTAAHPPPLVCRALGAARDDGTAGLMGLQQFERRLERLVEGAFARAFRGSLQPVEIGRRLTREMDLRRTVAPRGTLAPNRFTVVLSRSDRDRFAPIESELISELEDVAREHADAERYVLLGPISIVMETDEDLAGGTVLISGEMAKPAAVMPEPVPGAPAPGGPVPGAPALAGPVPAGPAPGSPAPSGPAPGAPVAGAPALSAPALGAPAPGPPAPGGPVTAPPVVAVQASLVLADGHRVDLGTKPLIVGRLPDSGLVLTDPNVSRYHAEIRLALDATRDLRAPEYEVCDMGSTNGTRVNGIAITGAQVLQDGDSVTIGATTMRFERS
jgi:Protein of unknown function (DUF3662)/FHA domain